VGRVAPAAAPTIVVVPGGRRVIPGVPIGRVVSGVPIGVHGRRRPAVAIATVVVVTAIATSAKSATARHLSTLVAVACTRNVVSKL
jgi:hypothetical protein